MKVLFLLFLVFITYSNSRDIQFIKMGDSVPKNLRASLDTDYFFFVYDRFVTYNFTHLVLLDNQYDIYPISYCLSFDTPSDSIINECDFNHISY